MEDTKEISQMVDALKDQNKEVRRGAAEALGRIGDTKAINPLITALDDHDEYVRRNAAEALSRLGSTGAVDFLVNALKDKNEYIRALAAAALEQLRKHLEAITKEKSTSLICSKCFCRFKSHYVRLGFLNDLTYYTCRKCHGWQFIDNAEKVIAVFDLDFKQPYAYSNIAVLVNWFKHKEPFDFDEVHIITAEDFDVEEFVMKMRNDVDKVRRKRNSSIPLYISPGVRLKKSKINLLKSTFSIGANDNAK